MVHLAGHSRLAFGFGEGDGLLLTGVPTAARSTYTIEVWFEFDLVGPGFRRIMSFGPNDTDTGLYLFAGKLSLYPNTGTAGKVANNNQWVKVRVTRLGTSKAMKLYVNGVLKISYTDSSDEYLLRDGQAMFFQDDGGPGESPSGTAAQIKVWDRVVAP